MKLNRKGFVSLIILLITLVIMIIMVVLGLKYYWRDQQNQTQTKSPKQQAEDLKNQVEETERNKQKMINEGTK